MSDFQYVRKLNLDHCGMVYSFIRKGNDFIHTKIEGELLNRLGHTPIEIIGKTLYDFLPLDHANRKLTYYEEAWKGKFVQYESRSKGIYYIASLRPIIVGGEVVEVVGSCINVTDHIELLKDLDENQNVQPFHSPDRKNLMIKENYKWIFVPLDEIIFIERVERKSVIHTYNRRNETYEALTSLHQQLDERFIRSHKSFILNIDFLEVIEQKGTKYIAHFKDFDYTAKISNNMVIPLKNYKSTF